MLLARELVIDWDADQQFREMLLKTLKAGEVAVYVRRPVAPLKGTLPGEIVVTGPGVAPLCGVEGAASVRWAEMIYPAEPGTLFRILTYLVGASTPLTADECRALESASTAFSGGR